jgi:transposase-like protein
VDKTIGQAARELGINVSMLRRWVQQSREAAQGGLPPFPGRGRPRDEELTRLRKKVKALRTADEILKKAAAVSAQGDPP